MHECSLDKCDSGVMRDVSEFEDRLHGLKDTMEGYCSALESIQDYLDLPGYGLWQDELARVIAHNLRRECSWMIAMQKAEADGSIKVLDAWSRGWQIKAGH